jgi:hypothetical protein
LTLLADIPGGESYLAILKLAESQTDPELSAWLRTRAFQKATADSDGDAWSPGQIAEFGEALERTPKNPLELFELVCLRLEDLKVSLESGDTSMAAILLLVKDEETLRNYFGDQFRTTARGRYSVPQEEELADAKRPDIRVHGSGFDAAVPIELKIADSWSGNQLFERLEEQLCGDYLRDPRSARGVFLLVHRGDKPRWDLPSGQRVDFGGLVDALQTHWIRLAPHYPHIQDVRVFGIDLTERSK